MKRQFLSFLCAAAAALLCAAPAGAAITVERIGSDDVADELIGEVAFTAEGRIGDGKGRATFELDLGKETSSPSVTAQYDWKSGRTEPFLLSYDPSSGRVFFMIGEITLDYSPEGSFDEFFLRARSAKPNAALVLEDLVLNGTALRETALADGSGDGLDILRVRGANPEKGFRLTGEAILKWKGKTPANSELAFQIKVVKGAGTTSVEEASWGSVKQLFR